MDITERIDSLLAGIRAKAEEDGYVSPDEAEMINQIETDLKMLAKHMKDFEEDNRITEQEFENFKELKVGVLSRAWTLAEMDQRITTDEEGILTVLFHLLDDLALKRD